MAKDLKARERKDIDKAIDEHIKRGAGRPPTILDEDELVRLACKGLPDKTIAVLMDCDVRVFAHNPAYRKAIDKARATLQLVLATNYIDSAKGTPAGPESAPGKNDGTPAVPPNLRAADAILTRLGYHDAPLDSELVVRVVWDDDAPDSDVEDAESDTVRTPVDIKTVVATAVATSVATRGVLEKHDAKRR